MKTEAHTFKLEPNYIQYTTAKTYSKRAIKDAEETLLQKYDE